jgi:thymidylate synthase
MEYAEFEGINSFLVGMSKILLHEGVERKTRSYTCYEIPNPVMIKIRNPLARVVTIPERAWPYKLPYIESLWIASGRNDMDIVGHYAKKLFDYSDDKKFMRAGYGPRIRYFNGIAEDYQVACAEDATKLENKNLAVVDQFEFIEKSFKRDPFTRQAIVSIGDPAKDCFERQHELKNTKDFPCTRNLQFIRKGNKLDLIVHMRSNDFYWGASGVNIFNFTFMQEYFAQILGLEVGSYYHIANNLHYYDDKKVELEKLASIDHFSDDYYVYNKTFQSLKEFDSKIEALEKYETSLRTEEKTEQIDFNDDFFNDWAKIIYLANTKDYTGVRFINPVLARLAKEKYTDSLLKENSKQFTEAFDLASNGNDVLRSWRDYI